MDMWDFAEKYFKQHRQAFDKWTHGGISDVWYDGDAICIKYTDGQWWHYKDTGSGVEWW